MSQHQSLKPARHASDCGNFGMSLGHSEADS